MWSGHIIIGLDKLSWNINWLNGYALNWIFGMGMGSNLGEPKLSFLFAKLVFGKEEKG